MTWFRDLDIPEQFEFLKNEATPFLIKILDSKLLYVWHILPLELYRKNELALTAEPTSHTTNITAHLFLKLLRNDPGSWLVIHFHGAGGTVGSGYRVPNYRAKSTF